MEPRSLKAESLLLILVVLIMGAVVVIQTIQTSHPPVWFETSVVPLVVALLMSIKLGVEKTLTVVVKDKEPDLIEEEKDEDPSQ